MISSPPEFAVRAVRLEDAEPLAELVAALADRLGVRIDFGSDDIRDVFRTTDLEHDAWAWERDGRLAAFGNLGFRSEDVYTNGFVHPDFFGHGLGTAILGVAEARARERGAKKLKNGILAADRRGGGGAAGGGERAGRRGLGLALLLRSFGQFYERGERRVALSVDIENPTGATRLYERAGMRVEREEVLYEKELAP